MVETIEVVKHNPFVIAGVAVMGLATGAFVGYKLAMKHLEPKYAEIADREIAEAKLMYSRLNKEGFESPTMAVKKLIPDDEPEAQEALAKYQGSKVEMEVVNDGVLVRRKVETEVEHRVTAEPAQTVKKNLFDEPQPKVKYEGWDYETEIARRNADQPYVITQDEYMENKADWEQIEVTYFEGDDVLMDDSEGIISDVDGTVGLANLNRFGHGSGEEHIVYIANEKSKVLWEVSRSQGKYAVEVLGLDDDDDEDPQPKRKRRLGD